MYGEIFCTPALESTRTSIAARELAGKDITAANILDYLRKLKDQLKMTVVFVTHDIGLANYVSDRIFIMHDGKIVNQGTPAEVLDHTTEPNTLKLLDDIPEVHKTEWIPNSHRAKKA